MFFLKLYWQSSFMTKPPSREHIDTMFNALSPSYDAINRLMTFGLDMKWRRALAKYLPRKRALDLLDIATGTGDQICAILNKAPHVRSVIGLDFAGEMLAIAEKKISQKSFADKVTLMKGDALALPFPDAHFDCVTISFGIRNVADPLKCLREIHRVLRTEGKVLILESSIPKRAWVRIPFLFYFRYIMPFLAGYLSRNQEAYRYLNESTETFVSGDPFQSLMKISGFKNIKAHEMALGAVILYEAETLW